MPGIESHIEAIENSPGFKFIRDKYSMVPHLEIEAQRVYDSLKTLAPKLNAVGFSVESLAGMQQRAKIIRENIALSRKPSAVHAMMLFSSSFTAMNSAVLANYRSIMSFCRVLGVDTTKFISTLNLTDLQREIAPALENRMKAIPDVKSKAELLVRWDHIRAQISSISKIADSNNNLNIKNLVDAAEDVNFDSMKLDKRWKSKDVNEWIRQYKPNYYKALMWSLGNTTISVAVTTILNAITGDTPVDKLIESFRKDWGLQMIVSGSAIVGSAVYDHMLKGGNFTPAVEVVWGAIEKVPGGTSSVLFLAQCVMTTAQSKTWEEAVFECVKGGAVAIPVTAAYSGLALIFSGLPLVAAGATSGWVIGRVVGGFWNIGWYGQWKPPSFIKDPYSNETLNYRILDRSERIEVQKALNSYVNLTQEFDKILNKDRSVTAAPQPTLQPTLSVVPTVSIETPRIVTHVRARL